MGGKSQKAPDYTELAAVSREAVAAGERIGNRQMDFAERQYEELKPILSGVADTQIAAQNQQMEQAKDYYDYQVNTFRPLEQGLVQQAQNFNTESYRERMAGDAAAAAGRAFQNVQRSQSRADAARGIDPNSPAARALRQQSGVMQAASRSQQMTGARDRAEQLGYARTLDAAGLGRGLAGASAAAYQGATGAGSAGAGTYQAAGNQYMSGLSQGASTMMGGYQTGMSGMQGIVDSQTSIYQTGINAQGEMMGALLGAGGTLGAAGIKASDRRLKEDIDFVGVDDDTGLNLYEFNYIGKPDRRFIGVMADEVMEYMPEAVIESDSGYYAVNYDMLGIEMVEV